MKRGNIALVAAWIVFWAVPALYAQNIVHFVSTNGLHIPPYTNWANASTNIQAAVDSASDGDTVLVGDGEYLLTDQIVVNKPILLRSVTGPRGTSLNGGFSTRCLWISNSLAVVNGFTITNAFTGNNSPRAGAGIYMVGATVENCTIIDCRADGAVGGGISMTGGVLRDSIVVRNGSILDQGRGGGVYCIGGGIIERCEIRDNRSEFVGAGVYLSAGQMRDSVICDNRGGEGGAGIYGESSLVSSCVISNNTYTGQFSRRDGGGAFFRDSEIEACTIISNRAGGFNFTGRGGGIFCTNSVVRNSLICGNIASPEESGGVGGMGGGLYLQGGSVLNCTVSGNLAEDPEEANFGTGGGMFIESGTLTNVINYHNSATTNPNWDAAIGSFYYSCTTPDPGGVGNITNDPQFVDPMTGDFHLLTTSPCRNSGINQAWMQQALDVDGMRRILEGIVDMGAFEFSQIPSIVVQPQSQTVIERFAGTLAVVAMGVPAPTYQWFFNETNAIAGATNSTLQLPLVLPANAGRYIVVVSNSVAIVTSLVATVTITNPPGRVDAAYVANFGDDTVSVIRRSDLSVLTTIAVGDGPMTVVSTPDGRRIFVANNLSDEVTVIDTVTAAVLATIPVGTAPLGLAPSFDSKRLYVANSGSSNISVVDVDTLATIDTIATPPVPSTLAYHPNRPEFWIGYNGPLGGTVLEARSALGYSLIASNSSFTWIYASQALCFRPNGYEAFAAEGCGECGRFHRLSGTSSNGSIAVLETDILGYDPPGGASSIAVHPMTDTVYLGKAGHTLIPPRPTLHQYGIDRSVVLSSVPRAMAADPSTNLVWVALEEGVLAAFDPVSFDIAGTAPVGSYPSSVALAPFVVAAPTITRQPESQRVSVGDMVSMSVDALGTFPLTYQWLFAPDPLVAAFPIVGATNSTLTFTNVQLADAGWYSLMVSNVFGTVASAPAALTVSPWQLNFYINGQQESGANTIATNPPFVEILSSFGDAHIWYTRDGSAPESRGLLYTGPFIIDDSSVLRAVSYDTNFNFLGEAGPLTVSLRVRPRILAQPESKLAVAGDSVLFSILDAGSPPRTYQWRSNDVAIVGQTNSTLLMGNVDPGMAAAYTVRVTNAFGSATSIVATLTVLSPPGIIQQPTGTIVAPGSNVTLCVVVNGTPPFQYQWRLNGVNLPNATNSCLTVQNVRLTNSGSYTVAVGNQAGALLSQPAHVRLNTISNLQPADAFADAIALPSTRFGIVSGTNTNATREPGEPDHAGKPGGRSVWYKWQATNSGIATFHTRGSDFDTLLAVYTNNVQPSPALVSDDDSGGFLTSLVQFQAVNGRQYWIGIDGFGDAAGQLVLSWTNAVTPDVIPHIVRAPTNVTTIFGGTATFAVTAQPLGLSYQWYFNTTLILGATNSSYTINNAQLSNIGFYTVRVRFGGGPFIETVPANLEIGDPTVMSVDKLADFVLGSNGLFAVRVTGGSSAPAAGWINARLGVSGDHHFSNTNATPEGVLCDVVSAGATLAFHFTNAVTGTMVVDTEGSTNATVLGGYQYTGNYLNMPELDCDHTTIPFSRISFTMIKGKYYVVSVDTVAPQRGLIRLNWQFGLPPVITNVSPHQFVSEGTNVLLRAGAMNRIAEGVTKAIAPPVYQWSFNGSVMPGETNAQLSLNPIQLSNAGDYMVTVANAFGSTSAIVHVVVTANQLTTKDHKEPVSEVQVGFTVNAGPGCPVTYTWWHETFLLPDTGPVLTMVSPTVLNAGSYIVDISTCFSTHRFDVAELTLPLVLAFRCTTNTSFGTFQFDRPVRAVIIEAAPHFAGNATQWTNYFAVTNLSTSAIIDADEHCKSTWFYRARGLAK